MSELYHNNENNRPPYWDRKYYTSFEDQIEALHGSSTIYVGNLSIYTTEHQIHEMMSTVGPIKRIIMGLNKLTKQPCGFCFVEYFTHENAVECLKFLDKSKCDDRVIKCELDGGFLEGRQYGRGAAGGQIRDERRTTPDVGRGYINLPGRGSGGIAVPTLGKRSSGSRDYSSNSSHSHQSAGESSGGRRGKDGSGRERPPPPPTDPNGALSAQRRPPPPPPPPIPRDLDEEHELDRQELSSVSLVEVGDKDDTEERPRKNPRFREDADDDKDIDADKDDN